MANQPENKGSRSLLFQSYTYWLYLATLPGVGLLVLSDLRTNRHLCPATGLESDFGVLVCLLVAYNVTRWVTGGMVFPVYQHVTRRNPHTNLEPFVHAGGSDVMIWCNLLAVVVTAVVFATTVPAGLFGWARPGVLVLTSAAIGGLLTWVAGRAVFGLRYRPRIIVHEDNCMQTYKLGGRCGFRQHGEDTYCRWHKILHDFRKDLSSKAWAVPSLMVGAAVSVTVAVHALSAIGRGTEWLCLGLAAFAFASVVKLFADGMLARDYPFSEFTIWPMLLTAGLAVEAVAGFATASALLSNPQSALTLVGNLFPNSPWWQHYGPAILTALLAVVAAQSALMLLNRVLFYRAPYLGAAVFGPALAVAARALWPLLHGQPTAPQEAPSGDFWRRVVGNAMWVVGVAWLAGFALSEVINVSIRRRQLTEQQFRDTVWVSYPVCIGAPMIGLAVSRYSFAWLGIQGPLPFLLLAVAVTIPACILGTHWANSVVVGRTKRKAGQTKSPQRSHPGTSVADANGDLGAVHISPMVQILLSRQEILVALSSHRDGLRSDGQLLSAYQSDSGLQFLVVTQPEHAATAVLMPEELHHGAQ